MKLKMWFNNRNHYITIDDKLRLLGLEVISDDGNRTGQVLDIWAHKLGNRTVDIVDQLSAMSWKFEIPEKELMPKEVLKDIESITELSDQIDILLEASESPRQAVVSLKDILSIDIELCDICYHCGRETYGNKDCLYGTPAWKKSFIHRTENEDDNPDELERFPVMRCRDFYSGGTWKEKVLQLLS